MNLWIIACSWEEILRRICGWINFVQSDYASCFVACVLLSSLYSLDAVTLFHGLLCSLRRQGSHGAESHSPNAS